MKYETDDPPTRDLKRRYRYRSLVDFPIDTYPVSVPVTEENFQYFFYRDLGALGSKGKRDFHEFESKRAPRIGDLEGNRR